MPRLSRAAGATQASILHGLRRLAARLALGGMLLSAAAAAAAAAATEAEAAPATATATATAALRVIHPAGEAVDDPRDRYPRALLQLALEASGRAFALQPAPLRMQQSRALRELERGERLDVLWTVTSAEREARLREHR